MVKLAASAIGAWRSQLEKQLVLNGHRTAVILKGDIDWACEWLTAAKPNWQQWQSNQNNGCVFAEQTNVAASVTHAITNKTYRHHLGGENTKVAFFDDNVNVDAFAALSGTLVRGGIMYCWLPNEIAELSTFAAFFLHHANLCSDIPVINQADKALPNINASANANANVTAYRQELPNEGQLAVVDDIVNLAQGRANNAFVLTADRGRGKSTALALAASKLLSDQTRPTKIIITAPHRMAVNIFFNHLKRQLPEAHVKGNLVSFQSNSLQFVPVDVLIKEQPEASLLLVDEAAGVPVYLLEKLSRVYVRIVFSSTIHGYEGAGKGFTHKFLPLLRSYIKRVSQRHLVAPIRWNVGDPLEQFTRNACLLAAELDELSFAEVEPVSEVDVNIYNGKQLAKDHRLLSSVFAILVTAHYQTKPSDLKILLDDDNIFIVVAKLSGKVVAVALVNHEQEIEPSLKMQVAKGERRIKGHLIGQALAQQLLCQSALDFQYLRVMRIAVHPELQGKGLGAIVLTHVKQLGRQLDVDCIATSFAASERVVNFWLNNQFKPVKLGFNKDASSGEHSLIMMCPLNNTAKDFNVRLQDEFFTLFTAWLQDEFSDLDYRLVMQLLSHADVNRAEINQVDNEKITAFVNNDNLYSIARISIAKWLMHELVNQPRDELKPLMAKCLMLHHDQDICRRFGFIGKKALYQHFQHILHGN